MIEEAIRRMEAEIAEMDQELEDRRPRQSSDKAQANL
jgi:hypothetical protein